VAAAVTAETIHVYTDPAAVCGRDLLRKYANRGVVAGKRGHDVTFAACPELSTTRVDVNGTVRRHLGVRKASSAPRDTAVGERGMEYGGITRSGCPAPGRCGSARPRWTPYR
jgi:hypothetical protein